MDLKSAWTSYMMLIAVIFASAHGESLLCGPSQEVKLRPTGRTSAVTLTLANGDESSNEPCTLNIYAPDAYALSLRIINAENPFEDFGDIALSTWGLKKRPGKNVHVAGKNKTVPDCTLQVFTLDSKKSSKGAPALKVSPCTPRLVWGPLEMLPQPVRVEWWPPKPPKTTDHLRLVVTAVSAGEACLAKDQVVCLRAGEEPLLCVSEALACDGVRHCPEGAGDESRILCDRRRSNWVEELLRRIASRHGELLGLDKTQFVTSENASITVAEAPKKQKKITALEAALAPYGPWGYLLLGTLIAAMAMVLFAVWECFCHKTKPPVVPVPPECEAPAAVILGGPQRPARATRSTRSPVSGSPPSYDTLEQPPPPYSVLFPRANKVITPSEIDNQGASTSSLNESS